MEFKWHKNEFDSTLNTVEYDLFMQKILSEHIGIRALYNQKESMLLNYLNNNFYLQNEIEYPLLKQTSQPYIKRKEQGSQVLYGKQIMYELIKIFGFEEELVKEAIKYWLGDRYFNELWENPQELAWGRAVAIMRRNLDEVRVNMWNSIGIPSNLFTTDYSIRLVNPDNA